MKNKIFIIISIALFTLYCNKTDNENQIIDKNNFISLLVDIHIFDATLVNSNMHDRKLKKSETYYDYIFHKHKISRIDFEKTVEYYSNNIDEYNELYDRVIKKLNAVNDKLDGNKMIIFQMVNDSLKKHFIKK